MGSAIPRDPTLPRPPVVVDGVIGWAWQITKELDVFFKSFAAVKGFATPKSGAPFVSKISSVSVSNSFVLNVTSLVLEITSTTIVTGATPTTLHNGVDGQFVVITNVGLFSITIASGTLSIVLNAGASTFLRWSNALGQWTKVIT